MNQQVYDFFKTLNYSDIIVATLGIIGALIGASIAIKIKKNSSSKKTVMKQVNDAKSSGNVQIGEINVRH